jgi:hypothetical protein
MNRIKCIKCMKNFDGHYGDSYCDICWKDYTKREVIE